MGPIGPKWLQDGPKRPQDGPKRPQMAPRGSRQVHYITLHYITVHYILFPLPHTPSRELLAATQTDTSLTTSTRFPSHYITLHYIT